MPAGKAGIIINGTVRIAAEDRRSFMDILRVGRVARQSPLQGYNARKGGLCPSF
jgi:hypothetical protein